MLGAPEINREAQGDCPVEILVRVRPLSASEKYAAGSEHGIVSVKSDSVLLSADSGSEETRSFSFDRVANPTTTQADIFDIIGKRFTDSCLNGYNGSLFAHGQTGSGKTYTMRGPLGPEHGKEGAESGLIPRTFQYLFERIQTEQKDAHKGSLRFSVSLSYMQLYGEVMKDVLNDENEKLRLSQNGDVIGLKWEPVHTANECMALFRKGLQHLKVGDTSMNKQSSRSHSILTIKVKRMQQRTADGAILERCSDLKLIDLAGRERQKDSNADGQRLKEACHINTSLSALSTVIRKLADGDTGYVPYRDNKLTLLLKDSLSGKSKTGIVCNISPAIGNLRETLSDLKWAQRCKQVKTQLAVNDEINRDMDERHVTEIQELNAELARVQEQNTESATIQAVNTNSTLSLLERVFSDIVVAEESARLADKTMQRLTTELDLGVRKTVLKLAALEVAEQRLKERDELIRFRENERELMEQQHQAQVQALKTRIEDITAEFNCLPNSKLPSYSHLNGVVEKADPKSGVYADRPVYTSVPPPLYAIGCGVEVLRSDGVW
jgi:kinesin family member 15